MTFIGGADRSARQTRIQRQAELERASLYRTHHQMFDRIKAEHAQVMGLTYGMVDLPDTEGFQLGDQIDVDPIDGAFD